MREPKKPDLFDDAFDRLKRDIRFAMIIQTLTIILVMVLLIRPGHCP